jgi:cyclic dehypoxanthinyl futalosine synthase
MIPNFQHLVIHPNLANRLTPQQALAMYENGNWHDLASRAGEMTDRLHPGSARTYAIERNINYTNVCRCRCSFCAFSVSPRSRRAFVLTPDQIAEKIVPLLALGGTQILMQGGLNPDLPFTWYEKLLKSIKARFPLLHIHAFSPPEIVFFARQFGLSVSDVIQRLHESGLDTIPGGGAEILVDRVRREISPAKCTADEWLAVMRHAHRLGLCTTATMMFGHAETIAERFEHLDRLRRLQDESLAARARTGRGGFFTSFTAWPFQPGHTRLARRLSSQSQSSNGQPAGPCHVMAYEFLKMTAIARLYLDNIPNIQSSWVTQGPDIAQLSLKLGCNDLGALMMEENVVSAAGTAFALTLDDLKSLIRAAGFTPAQRNFYYVALSTC